jgi:hypothetical protein
MSLSDFVCSCLTGSVPREVVIHRGAEAIIKQLTEKINANAAKNKFGANLGGGWVYVTFEPNDIMSNQGVKVDVIQAVVSAFTENGFTIAQTHSSGHDIVGPKYMEISVEASRPGEFGDIYYSTTDYNQAVRLSICM